MQFIEFYRVSTQKQGNSGLGLDGQKAAVQAYIKSQGGTSIATFQEIVSGGNKERISIDNNFTTDKLLRKRPELRKALELASKTGAIIVVKEASRLTRFKLLMEFILNSNVTFVCADSPNDSKLIISLKTAINEEELLKVSARTKAALAARKAKKGEYDRKHSFTKEAINKGLEVRRSNAANDTNNIKAVSAICDKRDLGRSYARIAKELNTDGYKTARGGKFSAMTVKRLYDRYCNCD